jgi:hypothetical protein
VAERKKAIAQKRRMHLRSDKKVCDWENHRSQSAKTDIAGDRFAAVRLKRSTSVK